MITHTLRVGETGSPVRFLFVDEKNSNPLDWGSYTAKVIGWTDAGASWITEGVTGVTEHPTQTFTAVVASNRLICNGHNMEDNQQVVVSTSGALPGGLSAATRYYARNTTPNDFQLSERPNGPAIDITSTGSGTHSFYVVGTVQYDFQTGDVDTAGDFWLRIVAGDGSDRPKELRTAKIPILERNDFGA